MGVGVGGGDPGGSGTKSASPDPDAEPRVAYTSWTAMNDNALTHISMNELMARAARAQIESGNIRL